MNVEPTPCLCVTIRGGFDDRAALKSFGFRWHPQSKRWIRIFNETGAAKSFARDMRARDFDVSLHPWRGPLISRRLPSDIEPSDKSARQVPSGKARSYHGHTDFSVHYSGTSNGWRMKSRRR